MRKRKQDKTVQYLVLGLLAVGILYLVLRKPSQTAQITGDASKDALLASGGKRYTNKETRDITWNDQGLPTKIVITRDAVQT